MELYISNIEPFMDLKDINLVTNARRNAINKYVQTADKARCLVAGLLLRKHCSVLDDSQILFGGNGKPYLKNAKIHFNISHSGDYVVLATDLNEIGVDIEKIATYTEAMAKKCFTPKELLWLEAQKTNEAFFRLWTAKEAIMKATGLGFNLTPDSFCVLPMDSGQHEINGRTWYMDWRIFDGHIICCATLTMPTNLIIRPDTLQ